MKVALSAVSSFLFCALAASSPLRAGALVAAYTAMDLPEIEVSYSDLDVHSMAGVRQLYGRLQQAATRVCASYSGPSRDFARSRAYLKCTDEALARAIEDTQIPLLTEYAATRNGARHSRLARN